MAVVDIELDYTVYYINNSASDFNVPPTGATSYNVGNNISLTLTGLGQNVTYSIWVAAMYLNITGPYSAKAIATTYSGKFCYMTIM